MVHHLRTVSDDSSICVHTVIIATVPNTSKTPKKKASKNTATREIHLNDVGLMQTQQHRLYNIYFIDARRSTIAFRAWRVYIPLSNGDYNK